MKIMSLGTEVFGIFLCLCQKSPSPLSQDADNLDAIGAIGIGRTFSYGGAHNVVMYDEEAPLEMEEKYSEHNGDDPSTIHHFYHKLFKLADNMNTESARKRAKERTAVMKEFVKEFLDEWNGIK